MITALKSARASPDFLVNQEWPIRRLWDIAKIRSEKNRPDLPLLAVFLGRGVIPYNESAGQTHKPGLDLSLYQAVYPGDFVLNNQQAWRGSVGVSTHYGIVSPAYVVLSLSDCIISKYANYLFRSEIMVNQYVTSSKGVGDIQRDIYLPWLKNTKVPIPQADQQSTIARFLDWAIGRLDRTIRAKKKVIALLNEQKQAIIHRAVTHSLDPTAPVKPSGIPWLGDIPEHWEIWPLKRILSTRITDGPHETPKLLDQGVDFLSAESMVNGHFVFEKRRGFVSREFHEKCCLKCRPTKDDIFMCKSGATTGKVAIVETDREFSVWSPLALLRVNRRLILPHFLFVSLQTNYVQQQVRERWSFGTQQNLSMGAMGRISIAIPPLHEQEQALSIIEKRNNPIDRAINHLVDEIGLLGEYRTCLIADIITGNLDVRAAVAHLPAETIEPEDVGPGTNGFPDDVKIDDEEAKA